ncbi:MAG: winged helix DNA-binding domain-containing protein [Woeseia sp.]|nr:winged helix DNA-binding domain-containing protein [Woeseia sp.]
MPRSEISTAEARRIAVAAAGFDKGRPTGKVNAGHVRRVIENLGLLQLDFINVLVPAHLLVPFSRLGAYQPETFDRAVYGSGAFTEQWAHEACIVPVSSWPLLDHRRKAYRQSARSPLVRTKGYRQYLQEILDLIRERGALTASDVPAREGPRRRPGDWHRSVARWALEHHFGKGQLAVASRQPNFQRVYDLPERLIPDVHLSNNMTEEQAQREMLNQAASALGIATTKDLADYYRMRPRDAAPRLRELAEHGLIHEIRVADWRETAWLHSDARIPRRVSATSLLSPFDPLVWCRPRIERLFDFHYRIEIYVPAAKRRHGYYVLPFLCDDALVARVDLKAERSRSQLQVRAAYAEAGHGKKDVAMRLASELREVANWLQLESIKVNRKGDLASALRDALKALPA